MGEEPDEPQVEFVGFSAKTDETPQSREITALTNNIARLETSLDAEREERLEERFTWVCAVSILLDIIAVSAIEGSWLFVPIFMLQLVLLIGYAQKCGVDWAVQMLGWLLHKVSNLKGDD